MISHLLLLSGNPLFSNSSDSCGFVFTDFLCLGVCLCVGASGLRFCYSKDGFLIGYVLISGKVVE